MGDVDKFEAWRNTAKGKIILHTLNDDGSETRLVVNGGKHFRLKASDRVRHSSDAIIPEYDFFGNGTFVPVMDVIEVEEDLDVEDNRNLMSETEMLELAKGNGNTFNSTIKKIDGEPALRRLLIACEDADVPKSRTGKVKKRLEALGHLVTDKHEISGSFDDGQVAL